MSAHIVRVLLALYVIVNIPGNARWCCCSAANDVIPPAHNNELHTYFTHVIKIKIFHMINGTRLCADTFLLRISVCTSRASLSVVVF